MKQTNRRKKYFIEEFLSLIKAIVCNYRNYGIPFDDLFQERLLGLMEAKKRFEFKKGAKLSTYATYWIKKKVLKLLDSEKKQSHDAISLDEQVKLEQEVEKSSKEYVEKSNNVLILCKNLPDLKGKVLHLFFEEQKHLDEISNILSVQRERIRHLKQKALRILKLTKN